MMETDRTLVARALGRSDVIVAAVPMPLERHRALVARVGNERSTFIRAGDAVERVGERTSAVPALNRLLASEGEVLLALPPAELARIVHLFFAGAGSFIGSPAWLASESQPDSRGKRALDLWVARRPDEYLPLVRQACAEPVFEGGAQGWTLAFHVFTPAGAVERWRVAGQGKTVLRAETTTVLPAGALVPPYA